MNNGNWRIAVGRILAVALHAVFVLSVPAIAGEPAVSLVSEDDRDVHLPPIGRSLFDLLVAREVDGEWVLDVPFPFEALIAHIESGLREGFREPVKQVLHPLGRSLHRHEAEPHFFRHPRAVAAVDTESLPRDGQSGLMLKDRLYLGYQPITDSVELIAYNEAAARFEYQVVTDYREGGEPKVTYADRGVCTACHHNQALIYSVQPWAESNTNSKIAALLSHEASDFYGIAARVPFDIPESFDEATDRANYFMAYQRAWRDGCEGLGDPDIAIDCRRDGLVAALRYRLSGGYQRSDAGDGARDRFSSALTKGWLTRWPSGVAIPTADILDHDPLSDARYNSGTMDNEQGLRQLIAMAGPKVLHFDEKYEPLYERPPLTIWKVAAPFSGLPPVEPRWMNKVIAGLGEFLAATDIERLDEALRNSAVAETVVDVPCVLKPSEEWEALWLRFICEQTDEMQFKLTGRLQIGADGQIEGSVNRVRFDSAAPGGLALEDVLLEPAEAGWRVSFALRDKASGLAARAGDGNAIRRISISWVDGLLEQNGTATFTMANDFALLTAAVDELAEETRAGRSDALGRAPFRRVAVLRPIFEDLGIEPMDWCCLDSDHLPLPVLITDQ